MHLKECLPQLNIERHDSDTLTTEPPGQGRSLKVVIVYSSLSLSQKTNLRLFQTERVCRSQSQVD